MNNCADASLSAIPKAEQPSRQIVLIRHGQYVEKPVKDVNLTSSDCSHDSQQVLTELGRKQATLTGMRLKELLESEILYPIDTVYYSTMVRVYVSIYLSVYLGSINVCARYLLLYVMFYVVYF